MLTLRLAFTNYPLPDSEQQTMRVQPDLHRPLLHLPGLLAGFTSGLAP